MLSTHGIFSKSNVEKINSKKNIQITSFIAGDTPLHIIVRNCKQLSEVKRFIQKIGEQASAKMAKAVNDYGNLPWDLVERSGLNSKNKKKLYSILLPLTLPKNFKPLSDPINLEEILNRYPIYELGYGIYRYIKLACTIANQARKVIRVSTTHPLANQFSREERNKLREMCIQMRKNSGLAIQSQANSTNKINLEYANHLHVVQDCKKYHIGNCYEFAHLALHFLMKNDPTVSAVFYNIENGDHDFIIINNQVVCDAWAGEVYLVSEISKKLKSYRYVDDDSSYLNIVTSYNPKFHQLKYYYSSDQFKKDENKSIQQLSASICKLM